MPHSHSLNSGAGPRTLNPHIQPYPTMSKAPSIAIFAVGIILLVYGINASNAVTSSVSRVVTGAPTDKSIWLIVLSAFAILSGAYGLFRKTP